MITCHTHSLDILIIVLKKIIALDVFVGETVVMAGDCETYLVMKKKPILICILIYKNWQHKFILLFCLCFTVVKPHKYGSDKGIPFKRCTLV